MTKRKRGHSIVAAVTGGSTGMGREIATALARSGATVCLLGRSMNALELLQSQLGKRAAVEVYKTDLRHNNEIESAVRQIERKHGHIDILMNFAGLWHDEERAFYGKDLSDTSAEEIADVLAVSLRGAALLSRRVLVGMKKRKMGKIVFVSCGFAGPMEAEGWVHYYVASKAVEALTRGLASEFRSYNVQINCVAPWFVATEAVQRFFPDKISTALDPKDVVKQAMFLVSEDASHLSGQVIELRSNKDF